MAWTKVIMEVVQEAIFSMLGRKAPGPDGIGASVIRFIWEWDSDLITSLIHSAIHLGAHPRSWKRVKGVVIRKPGKASYNQVKSYRAISLLTVLARYWRKSLPQCSRITVNSVASSEVNMDAVGAVVP
jgi:hypothetical protein